MTRARRTNDAPAGPRVRYILIASNAYSGSTLLSYLLGQHPEIATVSDVSGTRRTAQMEGFACSCGLPMQACPFWQEIERQMRLRGYDDFALDDFRLGFDAGRPRWVGQLRARSLRWRAMEDLRDMAFMATGSHRLFARIARRNLAFAETVLDATRATVFVDASKERMRLRYLERYLDADLRVIHLVRDVRAVVDSTLRRGKLGLTMVEAAHRWARTNEAIARNLSVVPANRQQLIRYEDLCTDVEGSLATLFELCGVSPVIASGDLRADQHLLGNRMRLGGWDEVRLDEGWRTRLTEREQRQIVEAAGPVVQRLYVGDGRREAAAVNA
jgi:hypothetical protein